MKIISWSLVFVMIVFPLFFENNLRVLEQERTLEKMVLYDGAVRTAVQDAAFALQLNESQDMESSYDFVKRIRANKELAVEAFYETLFNNVGIRDDETAQGMLKTYIPLIAVVDYDGLWVYTNETFRNERGENVNKQVWKARKPFAYVDDQGNSLSFTLDDYVYVYDAAAQIWFEGTRADVSLLTSHRIALLEDQELFEQVRRTTIISVLQDNLAYYTNSYNEYVRNLGITYTFTLPHVDQEEWNNTINDVGVISFIQGVPVGLNRYNSYALGGSRLIKSTEIFGYLENGIKVYYRASDNYQGEIVEKFTSEKEAALAGYFPGSAIK
ncbi:hypothetical protein OIN60_00570 [Paenibacillus sp. P96]|uniref:F0F1-type ATP synthase n=1 Tax=Paenibacillus zeirhizosphaerae TaxID=2987519 RepID=A0ABT9FL18_9BACL|nr:hypothetical protein [Paenibacillus sp. P96]MDP4095285.1 hypothetical protein [Paenibacillus sp. P96]